MQRTILRFKDLKRLGIVTDRMTLRRRILNDGFPEAVELGPNSVGWAEDEVSAWLASRPKRRPQSRKQQPDQAELA